MSPKTLIHDESLDGVISTDSEGRPVVRFERHLAHPIDRVWRAITDPAEAAGWLGLLRIDPRVGGDVELSPGAKAAEPTEISKGAITALDPPRLLEYWIVVAGTRGHPERHVLRWELDSDADGCVLTFTNVFEVGSRASNSIICGWHAVLEQLEEALGGRPVDWESRTRERVTKLYFHYRNKPRA